MARPIFQQCEVASVKGQKPGCSEAQCGGARHADRSLRQAVPEISSALNALLADTFALYLKTKNFHWHVSGPHFRDYHLLLDEQAEQIFATTDDIAERVRKIGGTTLRSIGQVAKLQRVKDNDAAFVPPHEMLRELMDDNKAMTDNLREAREIADKHDDVGTTQLLETFIDQSQSAAPGSCSKPPAAKSRFWATSSIRSCWYLPACFRSSIRSAMRRFS